MSSAGPLTVRPQVRHEGFAFCAQDRYWFRPTYTEGRCPLCGEPAADGAAAPSLWERAGADRSWFGVAGLALLSLVMLTLVLILYFNG